jgi:hypothetical protein
MLCLFSENPYRLIYFDVKGSPFKMFIKTCYAKSLVATYNMYLKSQPAVCVNYRKCNVIAPMSYHVPFNMLRFNLLSLLLEVQLSILNLCSLRRHREPSSSS